MSNRATAAGALVHHSFHLALLLLNVVLELLHHLLHLLVHGTAHIHLAAHAVHLATDEAGLVFEFLEHVRVHRGVTAEVEVAHEVGDAAAHAGQLAVELGGAQHLAVGQGCVLIVGTVSVAVLSELGETVIRDSLTCAVAHLTTTIVRDVVLLILPATRAIQASGVDDVLVEVLETASSGAEAASGADATSGANAASRAETARGRRIALHALVVAGLGITAVGALRPTVVC